MGLTGCVCRAGVSQNHINLVVVNNVPLFFNVRDGPYMPTLRLLHQCMWPHSMSSVAQSCRSVDGRFASRRPGVAGVLGVTYGVRWNVVFVWSKIQES